jgi:succinate dehydrogenase/fumarate reductase flavoprotein subunit
MAAIEAAKYGGHVTLVDKGLMGRSGSSPTGDGVMSAPFGQTGREEGADPDSEAAHWLDTMTGGEWVNDARLAAWMVAGACRAVRELETFGIRFSRVADGRLFQYRTLGHRHPRACGPLGGGRAFMDGLRKETFHRGVQVVPDTMVTRLLVADGRVAGAHAIHTGDGAETVFTARAVVVAAGSATRLYRYTSASYHTTGDGFALGFAAGVPLASMEFVEFTIIPKVGPKLLFSSGISPFMGRGSRLVNDAGERFMEREDPERLERTTRARLIRAVYRQIQEGRGPVWNDALHFTEDVWREFGESSDGVLHKLRAAGIDYRRERFEWAPAVHTFLGGLAIEPSGATAVEGLFAAGESAAGVHGANRLSDNAITECVVLGKEAGRSAARHAGRAGAPPDVTSLARAAGDALRSLQRDEGEPPEAIERAVRETAWRHIGVIRDAPLLREGLARFRELRQTTVRVRDLCDLVMALELGHLALAGEIVCAAALRRDESRGQHYRDDFRESAPAGLRWTVATGDGERVTLEDRPVPGAGLDFEAALAAARGARP